MFSSFFVHLFKIESKTSYTNLKQLSVDTGDKDRLTFTFKHNKL